MKLWNYAAKEIIFEFSFEKVTLLKFLFTVECCILVQGAIKVQFNSRFPVLLAAPGSNQYSLITTYNQSRQFESDGDW